MSKIALSMIQLYQNQLQEHFYSLLEQAFADISKVTSGELPPLAIELYHLTKVTNSGLTFKDSHTSSAL